MLLDCGGNAREPVENPCSHGENSDSHATNVLPKVVQRLHLSETLCQVKSVKTHAPSTAAISPSISLFEPEEDFQWKKTERSRNSAPQSSITEYTCTVMTTFQLLSRPLTQGHVRTVALGPLRKPGSYTVTVLKGLYCDMIVPLPVRQRVFFSLGRPYWLAREKRFFCCQSPQERMRLAV